MTFARLHGVTSQEMKLVKNMIYISVMAFPPLKIKAYFPVSFMKVGCMA
jgi:hypothetical protein